MRSVRLALAAGLLVVAAGCADTPADAPAGAPPSAVPSAAAVATGPSETAQMVCGSEAQEDIALALNIEARRVETPTWKDRVYACRYDYPAGSFLMSVKDLSNDLETTDYYQSLAAELGDTQNVDGLGEGGFITANGSVVVRKDFKVLLVDDTALPARMSSPPLTPGNVAMLVAKTILGCWEGD